MGIKFHCPNGHKLNVKSFLAGKKAICPKCGIKVVVPAAGAGADEPAAAAQEQTASPAPIDVARVPANVIAVAPTAAPVVQSPDNPVVAATPQSPAGVSASAIDPIDEAPTAVWYVRPASGGQYGPAAGQVMRQWIAEGRVAAGSLVWRAGWPEWRSAAAVFSQLADAYAAAVVPSASAAAISPVVAPGELPVGQLIAPAAEDFARPDELGRRRRRRKRQDNATLIVSSILAVLAIILVIVLVLVITQDRNKAADKTKNAAMAPSARLPI